jgi:hypothetical protein
MLTERWDAVVEHGGCTAERKRRRMSPASGDQSECQRVRAWRPGVRQSRHAPSASGNSSVR